MPAMSQQPPRLLRVLVVEDNEDARETLCWLVGLWGHACASAPAGHIAVQAAASFRPDVVLMDIGLPVMNGWQAAREMREKPELEGSTFIAMTGFGRDVDLRRSRAEGFAVHLTKPVDPELLRDILAQLAAGRPALAH
jgi:two-component system, chemotaxis family, CheB/CheR fusion protein